MPEYDAETALVVVDMQNDFACPEGSLYVPGGDEVVPVVNREIERALEAGAFVVYTQDWHPESTPHFEKDGGIWPVHCVAGTWGAELHPDLRVEGPVVAQLQAGFLERTPRGRLATRAAWDHLGVVPPEAGTGASSDKSIGRTRHEIPRPRIALVPLPCRPAGHSRALRGRDTWPRNILDGYVAQLVRAHHS